MNRNWVGGAAAIVLAHFSFGFSIAAHAQHGGYGDVELVGKVTFSGAAHDKTGDGHLMPDGTPADQLGGFSGIAWDGGTRFLLLSDRGPHDGEVPYRCRFSTFQLELTNDAEQPIVGRLESTTFLNDGPRSLVGLAAAIDNAMPGMGRLDPEGICIFNDPVTHRKSIFIADEYGPSVLEFDAEGNVLKRFPLPGDFCVEHPNGDPIKENGDNTHGRAANRGMEGLTITPDGKYLVGIMQGSLIQDSTRDEKGWFWGTNIRLVRIDRETGAVEQFVYVLDEVTDEISEILAISEDRFLVLDRDGKKGLEAAQKKITMIDLEGATPLAPHTILPPQGLPQGIVPVQRWDFIDLLDSRFGLAGADFPKKVEGICFGPKTSDGKGTLFISVDNDFEAAHASEVFVFSFSPEIFEPSFDANSVLTKAR